MFWKKTNFERKSKNVETYKLKKFINILKDKLRRSFRGTCTKTSVTDLSKEAYIGKSLVYRFSWTYEQSKVHFRWLFP